MKKIALIFALLIAVTWMACDDDTTPVAHDLDGDWNLVSIICLCTPVNLNIDESIWTFDVANNQMVVQNNVPLNGNMVPAGNYTIDVDDANATITFSDISGMPCNYYFEDNNETLYIGCQVVVDGPLYTLIRGNQ